MEYVEEQVPGGIPAQRERLEDPGVKEFFDQTFFATNWYDVYPLVAAGHACGDITGLGFEEFVRVRGRHQVKKDLGLVRRALLRVMSPASLAVRVPKLNASYFDFVTVESKALGADTVRGRCSGLPAAILRWYQLVTETFIHEVVVRGGAESCRIDWDRATPDGDAHGLEVFSCEYGVHWTRS